jgi:hypothetical protein
MLYNRLQRITQSAFITMLLLFLTPLVWAIFGDDPNMPDSVVIGNLDGSVITIAAGVTVAIPVWLKNDDNVVFANIPIAIGEQYISEDLGGIAYGVLDTLQSPHWDRVHFSTNFINLPAAGLITYPIFASSEYSAPFVWLPLNTDSSWVKIADFLLVIESDTSIIGDTIQIIEGENPVIGGLQFLENSNGILFFPRFIGGTIAIVAPPYEYVPGDANMASRNGRLR